MLDEMKDSDLTIARHKLTHFFRNCGLFPLEKEVKSAFRAVFKGIYAKYYICIILIKIDVNAFIVGVDIYCT